jgi:hypothetical protein
MLTMSSNQSLEGTQMLWDYLDKKYKQNTVAPAYQLFHKINNTHLSNNGTVGSQYRYKEVLVIIILALHFSTRIS